MSPAVFALLAFWLGGIVTTCAAAYIGVCYQGGLPDDMTRARALLGFAWRAVTWPVSFAISIVQATEARARAEARQEAARAELAAYVARQVALDNEAVGRALRLREEGRQACATCEGECLVRSHKGEAVSERAGPASDEGQEPEDRLP